MRGFPSRFALEKAAATIPRSDNKAAADMLRLLGDGPAEADAWQQAFGMQLGALDYTAGPTPDEIRQRSASLITLSEVFEDTSRHLDRHALWQACTSSPRLPRFAGHPSHSGSSGQSYTLPRCFHVWPHDETR